MDTLLQNGRLLEMMQEGPATRSITTAAAPAPKAMQPFGRPARRQFLAAASSRLNADWPTTNVSMDEEQYRYLRALRGRSRWLANNNGYYMRYIGMCVMNIVGPSGVRLEARVLKANSKDQDLEANTKIELSWREWSKKGNCSRRASLTRPDLERVIVGTVVRDGEIFLRKWFGAGSHGFQIEMIDPMRIPTDLNRELDASGTEIINGIEYQDGDVIAYWVIKRGMKQDFSGGQAERVPAKFIEHLFFPMWSEQKRGLPWLASGMQRIHMMDRYENAEVVAARIAAENGGGFFRESPASESDGFTGAAVDEQGNPIEEDEILYLESEAGSFGKLPTGWEFQQFDSKHPTNAFEALHSKLLRGIAAAGNVPYFSFANDLGDVNYSSARIGLLEVRDNWQEKQNWLISWFHERIYSDWLRMAMGSGKLLLNFADSWRYERINWAPRSWSWVDPEKEAKGNLQRIRIGAASPSDIAAEQGKEFEEVVEQQARDKATLEAAGVTLEDIFGSPVSGTTMDPAATGNRELIRRIEELERRLAGAKINGHHHATV